MTARRPSRHRRLAVGGILAAVVAVAVGVAVDPVRIRDAVLGGSCPAGVAAGEPATDATASTAAPPTTFTAPDDPPPASVAVVDGRRVPALWPFSVDSPWNLPLGADAEFSAGDDDRLEQLRRGRARINIDEFSMEIHEAGPDDPVERVEAVENQTTFVMSIPEDAEPSRGTDANLNVVQPDGVTLWENWIVDGGPGDWTARYSVRVSLEGDGISGGVRAYGGSTAAGLVRRHELEEGHIPHAIAMALCASQLRSGPVWPATREDGGGRTTGDYTGLIAMGTLLALPPEVDIDSLDLSPAGATLARAFQTHGGYVTDSAGSTVIAHVEPSTPDAVRPTADDAATIRALLRIVENAGRANPGGPGTRVAPLAPPLR